MIITKLWKVLSLSGLRKAALKNEKWKAAKEKQMRCSLDLQLAGKSHPARIYSTD
jgi:hypothetical protein